MNEDELKHLWKTEEKIPEIDVAELQKVSDDWYKKLRRKAQVDILAQVLTTAACFIPVVFYPRLIFAAILVLIVGIWYVRELNGLYKWGSFDADNNSIQASVRTRIQYLRGFFRRTRIALYILVPLILIATYYGLGVHFAPSVGFTDQLIRLSVIILFAEFLTVVFCEIYFMLLYKPAFKELREISTQLDSKCYE